MAVLGAGIIGAFGAFEASSASEVFGPFAAFVGVRCSAEACRLLAMHFYCTTSWAMALRVIVPPTEVQS
jgi:hypothetical protein